MNPDEIDLSELEALGAQLDNAIAAAHAPSQPSMTKSQPQANFGGGSSMGAATQPQAGFGSGAATSPAMQQPAVQRVKFSPLAEEVINSSTPSNIDLLMDVSLKVSVELGRASMCVRDTLNLAPGHVIELDKVAGDPVDVLVNGRLIARGEVVVVDDQFGVRITEIMSPRQRVEAMR